MQLYLQLSWTEQQSRASAILPLKAASPTHSSPWGIKSAFLSSGQMLGEVVGRGLKEEVTQSIFLPPAPNSIGEAGGGDYPSRWQY